MQSFDFSGLLNFLIQPAFTLLVIFSIILAILYYKFKMSLTTKLAFTIISLLYFIGLLQTSFSYVRLEEPALWVPMEIIAVPLGFLIALLFAYFLFKEVIQPLNKLVVINEALSQGELKPDFTVNTVRKDEIGKLNTATKTMVEFLRLTINNLKESSRIQSTTTNHFSSSTEEMNASSSEISSETSSSSS